MRRTNYNKLDYHERSSESHAINCQFVLGLMQIGGGNAESEIMLNFLDLPHGSSFKSSTFSRIQLALRTEIKKILNESMIICRMDKIKSTFNNK